MVMLLSVLTHTFLVVMVWYVVFAAAVVVAAAAAAAATAFAAAAFAPNVFAATTPFLLQLLLLLLHLRLLLLPPPPPLLLLLLLRLSWLLCRWRSHRRLVFRVIVFCLEAWISHPRNPKPETENQNPKALNPTPAKAESPQEA